MSILPEERASESGRAVEGTVRTLRRVVMANVAMLRLSSLMSFSMSRLHAWTAFGCVWASLARVRMAANLSVDLGDERNSCRTASGAYGSSQSTIRGLERCRERERTGDRAVELGGADVLHVADGASGLVVDHVALVLEVALDELVHGALDAAGTRCESAVPCGRRKASEKATHLGSSSMTLAAKRMSMQMANGLRRVPPAPFAPLSWWIILVTAMRSPWRMR